MYTYDENKDNRLDRNEMFKMGMDIAEGDVDERIIEKTVQKIDEENEKKAK